MAFFKDLGRGFSSHADALVFLFRHNLWFYFIYPVLIAIAIFFLGVLSYVALKDWMMDQVMDWLGLNDLPGAGWWGGWVKDAAGWVFGFTFGLIFFFIYNIIYKYILLIILSPVLAYLSERIEEVKSMKTFPFDFGQLLKDILRGILIALRNLFIELGVILLCTLIAWLPGVGWLFGILLAPFLYILASYFLGFSMMDYTCERHRMKISQSTRFIRKHKGIAIGNGIVFNLLLLIPFVGISIGPILSVTAATLASLEAMEEDARASAPPAAQP